MDIRGRIPIAFGGIGAGIAASGTPLFVVAVIGFVGAGTVGGGAVVVVIASGGTVFVGGAGIIDAGGGAIVVVVDLCDKSLFGVTARIADLVPADLAGIND